MKEFFNLLTRFVSPYKRFVVWAIILNVLSAIFNVFSFSLLIPILNILFKTDGGNKVYTFMEWGSAPLKDTAVNNFYYYVSKLIEIYGSSTTLLWLGLFLAGMTVSCRNDTFENCMLFRIICSNDSIENRSSTRHKDIGIFKNNVSPTKLFLIRKKR